MALPQFSRNYTRSGAYENPVTPVDTQSGAIWARSIESIGNSIAGTIESISQAAALQVKQTQKVLDENAKFILDNYDDFLKQSKSGNESFNNLALDIIRKKGEAYTRMKKGDEQAAKDFSNYNSKLNELINLATAGNNAIESYTDDYLTNYSKVNTPGGVSTVGIDPTRSMNYQLAMPAKARSTKNGSETWYLNDNDDIRTRYTSDQITKAFRDGHISNPSIDADPLDIYTFDAGVVDDIRKETLKFFNESKILYNGEVGKGFLKNEIKTIPSGKVEYDFQEIDQASVTASSKDFINAKAKTYLGRPAAANNLWNHQLEQGRNIKGPDGKPLYPDGFKLKLANGQIGTAFDTETSKVFTEALSQYMFDILPEGKQGSVRKIQKQEEEDDPKLTPAQKAAIKRTEDRASTVVDLLTENPERAIATYLGEIDFTRRGNEITIQRDGGSETWDLSNPGQFENLATELHKKKYGDDDKTLDAIRDVIKVKDFSVFKDDDEIIPEVKGSPDMYYNIDLN